MKRLFLLAFGFLSCMSTAHAVEFGVDIGGSTLHSYTSSANAWSSDRAFGGFEGRAEIGFSPEWRLGLGWHNTSNTGNLHQHATDLGRNEWTVDGRYRYLLFDWLVPYARAGLGLARLRLTLDDWQTVIWTPELQLGAGVELLLPRRAWSKDENPLPAFGVLFELGWEHLFSHDVTLQKQNSLQSGVATDDLALGALTLDGLLIRFAALVRF